MKHSLFLRFLFCVLPLLAQRQANAQQLTPTTIECLCQQAVQSFKPIQPDRINHWMQDTLHIRTAQGKPTGLPKALFRAIQQAPTPEAIRISLQVFYRVPWPGRVVPIQQVKDRLPGHPCVRWMEVLLRGE